MLQARTGDAEAKGLLIILEKCMETLDNGEPVSTIKWEGNQLDAYTSLQLLTAKPIVYVCNVDEDAAAEGNEYTAAVEAYAKEKGRHCMHISAALEEEAAKFEDHESQMEFLEMAGLDGTSLQKVITTSAEVLGLEKFYTVGVQEARSWTINKGSFAVDAARKIHSDIARGFIRAEVIKPTDFLELGGEAECKAAGKMNQEGKEYVVEDGDIIHFRFNV